MKPDGFILGISSGAACIATCAPVLPSIIRESIDYDRDGREDFALLLNTATGEASLIASRPSVIGPVKTYHLRDGWAVRVLLKR